MSKNNKYLLGKNMSTEKKELLSPKYQSRAGKLICQLRTQSWWNQLVEPIGRTTKLYTNSCTKLHISPEKR